jgi:predicted extracellular nuclease
VTALSGNLAPGQYYLVKQSGGAVGVALPTADATGTVNMSGTAGKVALVNSASGLACNGGSTPCSATQLALIKDLVGYGGANFYETAAAPLLSNTTAALRLANGCTETDNNASDFAASTPTPRNTASPLNPCVVADTAPTVTDTFPDNGATNFPINANLSVEFSETVNVTPSWFTLVCSVSGTVATTFSGGPTTFTLDPGISLVHGESCSLTVIADQVSDQDGNDPPNNMVANFIVGFSPYDVCADPTGLTPIYQIQGNGLNAAITGTVTTQGVVVGDFEGTAGASGFYLQDLTGDGDASTSDGIFVFTGANNFVSAGQVVRVTGFARERFNQTTLNGSNSNTSAVPTTNILNCGAGSVAPTDVLMPFADANGPERYEGMLVRFPQSLVIAEYFNYDRFGELVLALPLDGETRPFTGTAIDEPGAPANARTLANNLRRITLDDAVSTQNPSVLRHPSGNPFSLLNSFRGGDTVTNTTGVLGFDFSLYRIFPTAPADYAVVNPRPASPDPVGGNLRVAAMNTLNFFITADYPTGDPLDNKCGPFNSVECRGWDSDQATEFSRQRDKLLAALVGLNADVIGLNELENSTGVDPLGDPNGVVEGLNALLGPGTYAYINTGTIGTDAIKVGIIYKPAKVSPVGTYQILDSTDDPRFIDTKSRPALAQTFEDLSNGQRFTVVVNHFKSKGSDCLDIGDPDNGDGQGNCSGTRTLAAQALVDWLATDPTGSGDPDFLIMGDLNSYAMEDPIDAVKAGSDDVAGTGDDYTNLIYHFQGTYAYSYTFDGQAGYLDHALANASMSSQITGAADWHINSDEPDVIDYDTSFKPAAQDALYEPNAYRSSDHDSLVVGLCLPPTLAVNLSDTSLWPANHKYVDVEASFVSSTDVASVTLISAVSNEADDGADDGDTINDVVIVDNDSFQFRAERSGSGSGRIYTVTYQATNSCGATTTATALVTVPLNQGD